MNTPPQNIFSFMWRIEIAAMLLFLFVIQPAKAASFTTGSMTTARANHAAITLPNGKILVVGGNATGAGAEIYDPATGTWTATSSMNPVRSGAATLLPNGQVLVVGGSAADAGAALYNPVTDSWAATSPMNYACGNSLTATLLTNGQVLVAGGSTTNYPYSYSTSELYDPVSDKWIPAGYDPATGTWSPFTEVLQGINWVIVSGPYMLAIHNDFTATLLPNGKVLVAGGAGTIAELYDPATRTWNTTGSLNYSRYGSAATLLANGKVLVAGGMQTSPGYAISSCEAYDPDTGTWTPVLGYPKAIASMQATRTGHTMTLLPNGQVLVTGGWSSSYNVPTVTYSSVEVYDPPSGTWTIISPLTTARAGQTATLLPNGKLLVAGGGVICSYAGASSYCSTLSSAELYDVPGGFWTATGSMAIPRLSQTASLLTNGQVLVTGGANSTTTELYDSSSGTWTATGSLNTAREFHTATVLPNGKVLVAGGGTWGGPTVYVSSTELYDPVAGTWATANSMNDARGAHTATLLPNGKVLVAGGIWDVDNPYFTAYTQFTAELYDPVSGTWMLTNSMTTARCSHTATLLPSGKVLVAGGVNYNGTTINNLSSAELFDPAAGTWTATTAMTTARSFHTATLLTNGLVLVAGGAGGPSGNTNLSSAELYDPVAGTWTATTAMTFARSGHTATLLPNGKGLIAGGSGASAELYDPATGTWDVVTPMNNARSSHTATLLLNGEVLVAGGDSVGTSAEIFDPPTGTPIGSLTVTLNPAEAATNGAQWQVDGRVFQTNGAVVNNLSVGNHTVTFKNIVGWIAPTSQIVTVSENITNTFFGTYTLAYSISVSASPGIGGTADGGGTFAAGSSQAVTATASAGFMFTNWTENGTVVSTAAAYNFYLNTNRTLVANFTDIQAPTNTITLPTSGQRWSNAVFTVTGTASDNMQVSNVWCQINGSSWNLATTTNNWTNWTATINLIAGTNTIQAYAVDTSGNISATNSVSFIGVLSTQLTVNTNGSGTVSPNYNGVPLQVWATYSMTATAGSGFLFTNWTGGISSPLAVLTNRATLQFVMQSNLVLQANFVDLTKPTINITNVPTGLSVSNAAFTVKGTARDNWQVTNVFYSVNSGGWSNATTLNNWTNWTAAVTLIPGTNTIAAYAVDPGGDVSPTTNASLFFVFTNQLEIRTSGLGTISPNYSNAWLEIGRNYSITSTPASGFVFTNWMISTNWIGGVTVTGTNLQFMMQSNLTLQVNFVDVTKPTVSITNLTAGQRVSNAVFTVKGTASDNWQVSNVVCQINGGGWDSATNINNWTNWAAGVMLVPGTNVVQVYAVDTSGNISTSNQVSFDFVVTNQLGVRAIGLGTIKPNYSNAWLEIGRNYSITSAPATGFVFTNWVISTNWIGGATVAGTNLQFMMQSNLTLTASFVETSKPTLTITAPTSGQHMTNALATGIGTASDNWQISKVWYQLNNGAWNLGMTTNSFTNWTTPVLTLVAGTNSLKAFALNLGGYFSITNSVSFVSSNTFLLQLTFTNALPMTTNGLVFNLQLSTGLDGHIQVSTNLTGWATLTNFVGTNSTITFRDPAATNSPHRFYRAVIP
jgi:hypothetical protein